MNNWHGAKFKEKVFLVRVSGDGLTFTWMDLEFIFSRCRYPPGNRTSIERT